MLSQAQALPLPPPAKRQADALRWEAVALHVGEGANDGVLERPKQKKTGAGEPGVGGGGAGARERDANVNLNIHLI